jgi:hypothetical protein
MLKSVVYYNQTIAFDKSTFQNSWNYMLLLLHFGMTLITEQSI